MATVTSKRYTVLNKRSGLTSGLYANKKEAQANADARNGYYNKKPGRYTGFTVIKVKG